MGRRAAAALGSRNGNRIRDTEEGIQGEKPKWYLVALRLPKLITNLSSFRSVFLCLWSVMSLSSAANGATPPTSTTTRSTRSSLLVPFLKCFALCTLSILVLVAVLATSSSKKYLGSATSGFSTSFRRGALQVLTDDTADSVAIGNPSLKNVRGCSDDMVDYVPCYQAATPNERRCLNRKDCIIRPPKGYRLPWKWPACRDRVWSTNVRSMANFQSIFVQDDVVIFPSSTAKEYTGRLEKMIAGNSSKNNFNEMGVCKTYIESIQSIRSMLQIRLVLDVGCSFALSDDRMMTMSLHDYQEHGSPVQVALERGLPAMIGSFSSRQLPFSAASYDMVHCKDCQVGWLEDDGTYLVEVHRLLRPGGYFVWTVTKGHRGGVLKTVKALSYTLCWELAERSNQTFVWRKSSKHRCYASRKSVLCDPGKHDVNSVWDEPMKSCILDTPNWHPVHKQHSWPHRLSLSSKRISEYVNDSERFNEDAHSWSARVSSYWSLFTPVIFSDHPKRPGDEDPSAPANLVRNVMDMNAGFGAFNAALLTSGKPVWVMNVVPTSSSDNTLPLISDRGLLGTMHDWCQAFPTYPRSYDLLYAHSLLSQELKRHPAACGMAVIVLEMDRLLRPEGWLLLQDEVQVVEAARPLLMQMRWETRVIEIPGQSDQRLLLAQKNWRK